MFGRPRFGPCRVCGYEPVERNAPTCPNCGANAPRRTPAGLALSIVVVLAVLAIFVVAIVTITGDPPSLRLAPEPSTGEVPGS